MRGTIHYLVLLYLYETVLLLHIIEFLIVGNDEQPRLKFLTKRHACLSDHSIELGTPA